MRYIVVCLTLPIGLCMVVKHNMVKKKNIGDEPMDPTLAQTLTTKLLSIYPSVLDKISFPIR